MKKLILLLLLIPSLLYAQDWQEARMSIGVIGGGVPAATGGDSCTGTLLFSWHGENADVTLGTPAGCAAGDTTGTANSSATISNSQFWDGSNSVSCPSMSDYYSFDYTSNFNETEGTLVFRIRVVTWYGTTFFDVTYDANNYLRLALLGTDEMRLSHKDTATGVIVADTTDANIALNTWYTVTAKWNKANVNPNLSLVVCDTDNANCSTTGVSNVNLLSWGGSPSVIKIGEIYGNNAAFFFDGIKIYNSVSP